MEYLEIAVPNIDGEAAEAVCELFNRYGHGGAVMEAAAPAFDRVTVRTVIPADDQARREHIEMMLALIGKALPHGLPAPQFTRIGETDWATAWREHFQTIRIGRRFVIKPSWREYTPVEEDIVIEIDPGLAFGSGLHPTTRLCLEIFETMDWAGQELFDVGTGSGILSIAAAKLGARRIRAVDIDEVAVRVAQENFARNGLADNPLLMVETAVGSAVDAGGRRWPVVVANILANILLELMPHLAAATAADGRLVLSGMILEQEAEVTAAAAAQGLVVVDRRQEEDWVALVVQRKEA